MYLEYSYPATMYLEYIYPATIQIVSVYAATMYLECVYPVITPYIRILDFVINLRIKVKKKYSE
jgi:hypothetical protein